MKKPFLFTVVFLLFFSFGLSQTGQVGSIQGTIAEEDGAPVPGVSVTISSPALIVPEISRVSSVSGVFRFPYLPPGVYDVTFQLQGFNTIIRKGIGVSAGTTTSLDIVMTPATLNEEIVVEGLAPAVDRLTTTKTAIIDKDFITRIPAARTLGNYFNMTPGTNSDTSHGSSVRDNVYSIDGVNTADPVVGTEALFFSVDTIEEISVQTGGLPAEYGQVRGAVVNSISKSGGNAFHGSLSAYYIGEGFQSNNTKGTPLEDEESGFKYEMEPGINLGGAIIKDRLWFFLNASFWKQETIVSGFPYDKEQETGIDQLRPYPYVKLTYQPNQDNRITLSYRYSDIRTHNRDATRYMTEDTTWEQKTPTQVINLNYTRFFGANFFMNVKGFAYLTKFDLLKKNDNPRIYEYTTERSSGSYGYDDLNPRDRYSLETDGTLFVDNFLGSHELKSGLEYMEGIGGRALKYARHPVNGMHYIVTFNDIPWYGYWYAPYDTKEKSRNISFFLQDSWTISSRLVANIGIRFDRMQGVYPPQMEDEGEQELFGYTYNRGITETTTAFTWNTLSPRIGIIYNFLGDGKTLLKASFARYYMANLTQWVSRGNPNGFVYYGAYVNADWTRGNVFALALSGPEYAPQYGYEDYGFKAPYTDEFVVGIEREIFRDASLGLRYIRKWDRNLIEDADANNLDLDRLLSSGEYDWINYAQVPANDPYDDSTATFWQQISVYPAQLYMINPKDAKRDYDGIEVALDKRYSRGWMLKVSYVWQKSRGLIGTDFWDSWSGSGYFQNPNAHTNAMGNFPFERRHQVKIQGMMKGPWGIYLGGHFRYFSGQRYTRQIRSQDLGLNLFQGNETIYAEKRGSRTLPALTILDLRLEKEFRMRGMSFSVFGDAYNVFNANHATDVYGISSNPDIEFEKMESIQYPRTFQIGARFGW